MSNWVDVAAIQQSVPPASLLRRYHVQLRRSGRDQYRGRYPIHRGEGPEAFHVHLSRNIFHCFSCGAGGSVLDFVAAMEGCELRQAALRLRQDASAPLRFTLRGVDSTHPYLKVRGIDSRTAGEFGLGLYRGPGILSGRLVIPIHDQRAHWLPTAAAQWITPNRATAFRRGLPKRKFCLTSIAPPPRKSPP